VSSTATAADDRNGAPEGVTHSHAEPYTEDDFGIVETLDPTTKALVRVTVPKTCTDKAVRIEHGGPDRIIENLENPHASEDADLDPETDDVIWDAEAKHWVRRVHVGEVGGGAEAAASA
jgi:hypothetical protein